MKDDPILSTLDDLVAYADALERRRTRAAILASMGYFLVALVFALFIWGAP